MGITAAFPEKQFPQLRFSPGDDRDRLTRVLEAINTVVHATALKQVPAAEYNPMEFINTNVLGDQLEPSTLYYSHCVKA